MLSSKNLNPIVTKLFVSGKKLNKKSKIIYQLPQNLEKNQEKKYILKNLCTFFEGRDRFCDASESKIFPIKIEDTGFPGKVFGYSNLKILTPKDIL